MAKSLPWAILCFVFNYTLCAQMSQHKTVHFYNQHVNEQCAHTAIHNRFMELDENYREEQINREESLNSLIENTRQGLIPKSNEIFTIPVVVHVIHKGEELGEGTNISDEQIWSAINGINEDFRKMAGTNGDGEGADIEIEFCLAQRDPAGNAHDGINRISGCSIANYCDQGISAGIGEGANELEVKNLSRWSNQDYYNIWIVSEIENNDGGSGIQGYAYFPTSSPVDGTVILYNAFGTTGNLKPYTNRNRTLTHELGHGFALYHTFHGESCSESNCNLQGDRVCDTPPTTLNASCSNAACSGMQQVENYMDYTSQNCKDMFTEGQKERMRLSIQNSRSNLIASAGCEPVIPISADAGILAIQSPPAIVCNSVIQPVVSLKNFGSSPLSNVTIQYSTGEEWQNFNWTGLLAPGQETLVTLDSYTGGWGNNTLYVKTINPNGGIDENPNNDGNSIDYSANQESNSVTVNIRLDILGSQTTWEIKDEEGATISNGGPYTNFQDGEIESNTVCLLNDCYTFVIRDAVGNGLCCANGNGYYEVIDDEGNILADGAEFGYEEVTNFCLESDITGQPFVDFSASETTICAGNFVDFVSTTTGEIDSFLWTFEGGIPSSSTQVNPTGIVYSEEGTYDVKLEISSPSGQHIELKQQYITILENITWYEDSDSDGYGNPNEVTLSCFQPPGFVNNGTDCNDNNSNSWDGCYDCLGIYNGTASEDNCGICDSNPDNDCEQDCAGVWGGSAYYDNCGVCDDLVSNDCTTCEHLNISVVSITHPTCTESDNGSISLSLSILDEPFDFIWNDGVNSINRTGLSAGVYEATLNQGNCAASVQIELSPATSLTVNFENISPDYCGEIQTGGCEIIVSGGTPPYHLGYNGINLDQNSFSNLAGGNYLITAQDVHGCSTSSNLFIETVGCDTLAQTSLDPKFCDGSSELDLIISSGSVPLAETYLWEITDSEGSGTLIETETNELSALEHFKPVPNHPYVIRIKALRESYTSFFGPPCSFSWTLAIPDIEVKDCSYFELTDGETLSVTEIEYAEEYEWRFQSEQTQERTFIKSKVANLESNDLSNLSYNEEYLVSSRINFNNTWGSFGTECKTRILLNPLTTNLLDKYCGKLDLNIKNVHLELQPIKNASVYQTIFIKNDNNLLDTVNHMNPTITPEQLYTLSLGTYKTMSRALLEDEWTPWGNECSVGFKKKDVDFEFEVFPNPITHGGQLRIVTRGAWEKLKYKITDLSGRIFNESTVEYSGNPELNILVPKNRSGMFFITIFNGGQRLTKKIIID